MAVPPPLLKSGISELANDIFVDLLRDGLSPIDLLYPINLIGFETVPVFFTTIFSPPYDPALMYTTSPALAFVAA